MLNNRLLDDSLQVNKSNRREIMGKSLVRIGIFEVEDAELSKAPDTQLNSHTLSIPCKSNTDLCMQLDGWDEHTTVPAVLDGKNALLYRNHYDRQSDAWVMRFA
ncbi:hypothetical protein HMPREF0454_00548 [Hafnia alvei ATCC 51873]|uniref:DUF1480 domain-containing protein n=2 Tax=Hafnia alvei TaxID=569 RepID=G9Y2R0_HAFAL|nr:hypothetical protein HMPREF0454_00548 [Hafnia alvei ATCC 51873]